jgi:hypothetical protein
MRISTLAPAALLFSLFDLGADGLALGGATGELRGFFGGQQGVAMKLATVNRAKGARNFMWNSKVAI